MKPLYFDYNATTPVHKDVVQAMLPFFTDKFGNPGCGHMHGLEARRGVEKARRPRETSAFPLDFLIMDVPLIC